jgi:hypothetical protein
MIVLYRKDIAPLISEIYIICRYNEKFHILINIISEPLAGNKFS